MIYRYCLLCDRVDRITVQRARNDRAATHQPLRKKYEFTLSILRVNQQTYQEALYVFRRENAWVLYSETRAVLRQNLGEVCFPLIGLREPPNSNSKIPIELEVRIQHRRSDTKMVSWFIVSRADAAEVSRFILTDKTLLHADYHLIFNTADPISKSSLISVFDDLHGMISVRVAGTLNTRTRGKMLCSMKAKRQTAQGWIASGRAWLSRGELNTEEFMRRGKDGAEKRYEAAMDSFESGWREVLEAVHKMESGDLACDASEGKEFQNLQVRFARATSEHCGYHSNRSVRHVLVTRASLHQFLKSAFKTTGKKDKDIVGIYLNMARAGLHCHDHRLTLYALAEALRLQASLGETQKLLTELDGLLDKSWQSAAFGVRGLFKSILGHNPHQKTPWSLVKPTLKNFVADDMRSLNDDVFDNVDG
ncbi:MAG: hypothetical protein Q9168_002831 [Polycauliona sp. 1 TL-2023]